MEWRDEGVLLSVRRHGESHAVIQALTAAHGRHAGLVRGGAGSTLTPVLQPGAQLMLEWRARLAEHLGAYRVEPIRSRAAQIMVDPARLAALNAVSALALAALPEREPQPVLYPLTITLLDALAGNDRLWPGQYARWELALLEGAGFGLDLRRCAATGVHDNLIYVSPRTGRAVCGSAGGAWADRLLPLPGFLVGQGRITMGAVRESLRLTGYFLETQVMPALEREGLPAARTRLVERLEHHEIPPPPAEVDQHRLDEEAYHARVGGEGSLKIQMSAGISM